MFVFGLGHADSVRDLDRRVDRALPDSSKLRQNFESRSGSLEEPLLGAGLLTPPECLCWARVS